MELFYFTFGRSQTLDGYCQPIVAENYTQAEQIMFNTYNKEWAFGYTEQEFNTSKFTKYLKHLPTVYSKEVMKNA